MIDGIEKKINIKIAEDQDSTIRYCDWSDCKLEGLHRAPKSHEKIQEYNWFCIEHVRIYNNSWNYYEGMSKEGIDAIIRSDTTWNRPTWPLGSNQTNMMPKNDVRFFSHGTYGIHEKEYNDPYDFFTKEFCVKSPEEQAAKELLSEEGKKSLLILGFDSVVNLSELKARYKLLVKKYHPDITGGNKKLEEKFKQINEAYEIVRTRLMNN
jgi:hypothetical protein